MDSPDLINTILNATLMYGAIGMFMVAAALAGYGFYANVLAGWLGEDEEAQGNPASALVRQLGSFNRRIVWPSYEAKMRKRLIQAGEPRGYRPEDILSLQELGVGAGILIGLALAVLFDIPVFWALPLAFFGAVYPLIWLRDQVKRRQLLILRALPYNLDLLTLAVEAGMDFAAALGKVVERGKSGPFREELQLVLKQLKMGKTREEALKSMVARVELAPLTLFVTALVQADRMGTGLGRVLRLQATQLRVERTQRAEKLANEAPVKMLFPLVACIFPTVFLILFGPIVFAFMFGNVAG